MHQPDVIENGSGNVYSDLGLSGAGEMQRKAALARAIGQRIDALQLSQRQAAETIGIPEPKLCGLLAGRFRGISEAKMVEAVARLAGA